jgi:hypothetical protein
MVDPAGTEQPGSSGTGGCLTGGVVGIVGFALAAVIAVGAAMTGLDGCELDLGDIGDPGAGTDSQRLEVEVAPQTGLVDRSPVFVTSSAFAPDTIVGVAVCLREADTERRGVDACDEAQGERFATDANGEFAAAIEVPRVITVDGRAYDCAESPRRCLVVAADANDYDRSGGQTISFQPDLPPVELVSAGPRPQSDRLPILAQPPGPVAPGTELTVTATGFRPDEPVIVAWCTEAFERTGPTACEPVDASAAFGAVAFRSLPDEPRADAAGKVTITIEARATIAPLSPADGDPDSSATTTRGDGRWDCRGEQPRCAVVVAAAADTKRSGLWPYRLTSG